MEPETRTVTFVPQSKMESRRALKQQHAERAKLDGVTVSLTANANVREVWRGKVYELAQQIEKDFEAGRIEARSLNAAFKIACQRYVRRNGRPFTAHSLRMSLRQFRDRQAGNF